jgi:hypothetical protein
MADFMYPTCWFTFYRKLHNFFFVYYNIKFQDLDIIVIFDKLKCEGRRASGGMMVISGFVKAFVVSDIWT